MHLVGEWLQQLIPIIIPLREHFSIQGTSPISFPQCLPPFTSGSIVLLTDPSLSHVRGRTHDKPELQNLRGDIPQTTILASFIGLQTSSAQYMAVLCNSSNADTV